MTDEELYGEDQCCDMCHWCLNCGDNELDDAQRENEELVERIVETLNDWNTINPRRQEFAHWLLARHPEARVRL